MPCISEYNEPNDFEREASRVYTFLDELKGEEVNKEHLRGFHPRAYNRGVTKTELDVITETLCTALQSQDVTKRSLELQIWWRDHQAADKARAETLLEKAKKAAELAAVLEKLTPRELEILGLKKK